MSTLDVLPVPFARDNYLWLIHDGRHAALVDPGEAAPALAALEKDALTPVAVLLTHHHGDHIGGVPGLLARHPGLPVYGPRAEDIAGVDHPVSDGDSIALAALGLELAVLNVAAHTCGHLAYCGGGMLFCGDALFSAGCGRLFEGTPTDLERALTRLAALDGSTKVYCGHEYTLANLAFARAVEPENAARDRYAARCETLRAQGLPTLPSTIELEKAVNPFLRPGAAGIVASVAAHSGTPPASARACLAALRAWKDTF
ncbi:MAG: hydroxyacylglutathione hydrolase [Azoarcus sp.]|jgi:hydroxyacylglutathione hydrolase|nr:hydroxyacylglutathione hydrolase [Azoarcus sp.]